MSCLYVKCGLFSVSYYWTPNWWRDWTFSFRNIEGFDYDKKLLERMKSHINPSSNKNVIKPKAKLL